MFYTLSDDRGDGAQYSEVIVGPTDLQASIEGLTNGETYEIRVAGRTNAGVGVVSEAVYARPGDQAIRAYDIIDQAIIAIAILL